jgi:HlyD family secretion protein
MMSADQPGASESVSVLTKNNAGGPGSGLMMLASQRPKYRPPRKLRSALVIMAAAFAVLSLMMMRRSIGAESAAAPPGMAVSVAKAKKACFSDTLAVVGTVVPRHEVLVRPDRDGLQIKEILVEPGETVAAAQVLGRLGPANEQQQGSIVPIRATVGGIIVAAPKVVGDMATVRGEPLFRIVADGELDLAADVPANRASRLSADRPVKVKLVGLDEISGRVHSVPTTIDPVTQLGQVRILLPRNPLVRIGVFARAVIELDNSCGVSVPLSALLFGPDGPVVQMIRGDRVETHRITIGASAKNNVQIRDGVTEGDLIVVRAGAFLREGDRVRPMLSGD